MSEYNGAIMNKISHAKEESLMKWKATIEKTDNGYILTGIDGEGIRKMVFKEKDEQDETNRDHVIEMLYDLLEFFAEGGSKHDKRRITMGYIPGNEFTKKDAKQGVEFEVY